MFEASYVFLSRLLHPYTNNCRLLTSDEIMEMMNLTKSAGHPWRYVVSDNKGKSTKKAVFIYFPSIIEDEWNKTTNTLYAFSGYLKPELIAKLKAAHFDQFGNPKIPSTRLFMAADVLHVALMYKVCGHSNKKLYAACWPQTPSALGWSKFYGNSQRLYDALPKFVLLFDISQNDSSCDTCSMYYAAKFSWDCLRAMDRTAHALFKFSGLIASLIHSLVILPTGDAIQLHTGNKSGQLKTSVDNTLINLQILIYHMLYHGCDPEKLLAELFLIICGDDGIADAEMFDKNELISTFASHGKFLKASVVAKNDAEFCSHIFVHRFDDWGTDHILMALPKSRILSSLKHGYAKLTNEYKIERIAGLSIESFPYPEIYDMTQTMLDDLNAPPCYHLSINQLESLWYGWESASSIDDFFLNYTKRPVHA